MKTQRIRALLLCLVVSVPISGSATPVINGIVAFGGSLTDSGNIAELLGPGVRTPWPIVPSSAADIPEALIPSAPYEGFDRLSNGPVWIEYFANELGFSSDVVASRKGGNNYAYGGARSGPLGALPQASPSFLDQVTEYQDRLLSAGEPARSDFLHVVDIGGNDARDAIAAALAEIQGGGLDPTDPLALIDFVEPFVMEYASNMATGIGGLNALGAEEFFVWNVPDLGLAPIILLAGEPLVSSLATGVAEIFNVGLDLTLLNLQQALGIHIIEFDAFNVLREITGNPAQFGLLDAMSPCALALPPAGNPWTTCDAVDEAFLFWDGIHATTRGHQVIAQFALQAVPEPATIAMLCLGIALLTLRRRTRLGQCL